MKSSLIKTSLGMLILATSLAGAGCTYYKMDGTPLGGKTETTGGNSGGGTTVVPPSSVCGNGVVEAGEQCDDGNTVSGDGCDANCQIEGSVTPPPAPVCKKGPADGSCSNSSECCAGTTCFTDCHTGTSFCGLEPPPTCGGSGGTSGGGSVQGQKCTLSGINHDTDSCPQGYSCSGTATTNWTGVCNAWVDGVDFCSGDKACVDHHGAGWTCSENRDCQPPPPIQGQKCTLTGAKHDTDSCPQGYSCSGTATTNWTGVCNAWVDGVDFCSSDKACVDHNGAGWTCSENRDCVPPPSAPQTALTIVAHYPDDNQTAGITGAISITFNKPVDPAAVKAAFSIKEQASNQPFDYYPDVSGQGVLVPNDGNDKDGYKTFYWEYYNNPLNLGQIYHYWILGGAQGVKAKDGSTITQGNEVPIAYEWYFRVM